MTIWSSEIRELEKLHHSIKESHPRLEKELSRLLKTDDENIVLVYARRCLEIIISDLCECELKRPRGSEPLKGIIDKLNREGKVPAHIIGSMNNINSISTFGSHPKAFDPRQVKPVLLDLTTTLGWYLKYAGAHSFAETTIQEKDQGNTQDNIPKKSGSSRRRFLQISAIVISGVVIVVVSVFFIIHPRTRQPEADESLAKSIAVIPFQNFSADTDQEFMCLGLTDEIINHLFRIESFDKVISLSTVLTYQGCQKKIPDIADELKVNYILEGTYKKIGDQIRVTAQLIEAVSDKHIWEHEYDRPYEEIIAVQADIALQIADHIKVFISDTEKQRIQKVPTTNQKAYELVQEAQNFYREWRFGRFDYWLNLLQQAIELDPEYADAYAGLAHVILSQGYYIGAKEMQSVAWEAMPYFKKALELDPENTLANAGMAAINLFVQWDYIEAAKHYSQITNYLTSDYITWLGYVCFLVEMGHCEELLTFMMKSEFTSSLDVIQCHILQGDHSQAYALIPEILGEYGRAGFARAGEAFIWLGDYDSARFYLETAMQVPEEDPEILTPRFQTDLALAYRMTGSPELARTIIDRLILISDTTAVGSPAFFTGWYYSAIGETDSAFHWLEKACRNRSPEMPWVKMDPAFNNLKEDPRYLDLYERTGHKAYDEYLANHKKI